MDATLIHAVEMKRVPGELLRLLEENALPSGCFKIEFDLVRQLGGREVQFHDMLFIFIRPYVPTFIKSMQEFCNLYLYTHGRIEYASAVLREIDPEGLIFKDVIALGKDEHESVKKATDRLGFT